MSNKTETLEGANPIKAFRISAACRALSISRSALYRELAAGRLEARKAGTITLIPAASVDAWLANLPSLPAASRVA